MHKVIACFVANNKRGRNTRVLSFHRNLWYCFWAM